MSRPDLSLRAQAIKPFHVMQVIERANALDREGHDVIHLEVGEPKFLTAQPLADAAERFLSAGQVRYTEAQGRPELRRAIARSYARQGLDVDPDRVVVTAGASGALLLALGAVLNPGDELLMADPSYPCNSQIARFVEGRVRLLPSSAEQGFQLTAGQVEAALSPETKAVLVASPSNPTGTLLPRSELLALVELSRARGFFLLIDEIYAGLIYEAAPGSAAEFDDVFVINSFSKTFGMTGWRLGWLVCPESHAAAVTRMAQHLFISPSDVSQAVGMACFTPEMDAIVQTRKESLRAGRDYLMSALAELGFSVDHAAEGAYYLFPDVRRLGLTSDALATRLLEEAKVATTPGHDFGPAFAQSHLRIAYVDSLPRLKEAVRRMAAVL